MPLRLTSEFRSQAGVLWKIEIHDKVVAGNIPFTLAGGFELRYDGQTQNLFNPILPSSVKFSIMVRSTAQDGFIADLIAAPEERFRVKIYKNNSIWWVGYCLTDVVQFEDEYFPYILEIRATDGLARLQGIDYANDDGTAYAGRESALGHLLRVIQKTGLTDLMGGGGILQVIMDWKATGMGSGNALEQTFFDHATFASLDEQGNSVVANCYEILVQIAQLFGMRFFWSEGSYRFVQVNEYASLTPATDTFYTAAGTSLGTPGGASIKDVTYNRTTTKKERGGMNRFHPPLKKVSVTYNHLTTDNRLQGQRWTNLNQDEITLHEDLSVIVGKDIFIRAFGTVNHSSSVINPDPFPVHRLGFVMRLSVGGGYLVRKAQPNSLFGFYALQYEEAAWKVSVETDTLEYEMYSEVITEELNGTARAFRFEIESPPIVTGGAVKVQFFIREIIGPFGEIINETEIDFLNWHITDAKLEIVGADTAGATGADAARRYEAINTTDRNSAALSITTRLGDGPELTSTSRLTLPNGDPTEEWSTAGGSENLPVLQLLASEVLNAHKSPIRIVQASLISTLMVAHKRYFERGIRYMFLGGRFDADRDTWQGEWAQMQRDPVATELPEPEILVDYEIPEFPGGGGILTKPVRPQKPHQKPTSDGIIERVRSNDEVAGLDKYQLQRQAVGATRAYTRAGAINHIKTTENIAAKIPPGAFFLMVNPQTGREVKLQRRDDNVSVGGTNIIDVVGITLDKDFPPGSLILNDPDTVATSIAAPPAQLFLDQTGQSVTITLFEVPNPAAYDNSPDQFNAVFIVERGGRRVYYPTDYTLSGATVNFSLKLFGEHVFVKRHYA